MTILFHFVAFLYYNSATFVSTPGADALDTILVVVNIVTYIFILGLFAVTLMEMWFRAALLRRMTAEVAGQITTLQMELLKHRDEFIESLDTDYDEKRGIDLERFEAAVRKAIKSSALKPSGHLIEVLAMLIKMVDGKDYEDADTAKSSLFMNHIFEFLGVSPASNARSSRMSQSKSITKLALTPTKSVTRSSPRSPHPTSSPPKSPSFRSEMGHEGSSEDPMSNLWKRARIQALLRKLCLELPHSFQPMAVYRFSASGEKGSQATAQSKLTALLTLSSRLAPYIPDSADVGSYSNAASAMIYKKAAQQMPRLLVIGMFGEDAVTKNLQYFLAQLENAERELSKEELSISETIVAKDRGPMLYWLLNERDERHTSAFVVSPAHARAFLVASL